MASPWASGLPATCRGWTGASTFPGIGHPRFTAGARAQPAALAVIETELWPGLFAACGRLGIPLFVVSGRMYPRDVGRYARLGDWWKRLLAIPEQILVQDDTEAQAFLRAGAPRDRV